MVNSPLRFLLKFIVLGGLSINDEEPVYVPDTLGGRQRLFAKLIAELITWAYNNGYEFAIADAYRNPKVFGELGTKKGYGQANSNHKLKLAVDLDLFIDGVYQTTTEAHTPIGEHWESMHPLCRWGGRFEDGNHYSFEYRGRQ